MEGGGWGGWGWGWNGQREGRSIPSCLIQMVGWGMVQSTHVLLGFES